MPLVISTAADFSDSEAIKQINKTSSTSLDQQYRFSKFNFVALTLLLLRNLV